MIDYFYAALFSLLIIPSMTWLFLRTFISMIIKQDRTKWLCITGMFFYIVYLVATFYGIKLFEVPL